jgi:hypothetical protein
MGFRRKYLNICKKPNNILLPINNLNKQKKQDKEYIKTKLIKDDQKITKLANPFYTFKLENLRVAIVKNNNLLFVYIFFMPKF